jgi:hypothetical protein
MLKCKDWLLENKGPSDEVISSWKECGLIPNLHKDVQQKLIILYAKIASYSLVRRETSVSFDTSILLIAYRSYTTYGHYICDVDKFCFFVEENLTLQFSPENIDFISEKVAHLKL